MTPPNRDHDAFPEHIATGLQATAALIQSLLTEMRDNAVALSALSADMKNLREVVTTLSKILKDGNGQPSLVTRMTLVEKNLEDMAESINRNAEGIGKAQDSVRAIEMADKEGARQMKGERLRFWASIIPGILAMVGAIIAMYLKGS